jgi:hypothetical protein
MRWSTAHNRSMLLLLHVMEHCAQLQFAVTDMWWGTAHYSSLLLTTCDGAVRTIAVCCYQHVMGHQLQYWRCRYSVFRGSFWLFVRFWKLRFARAYERLERASTKRCIAVPLHPIFTSQLIEHSYITDSWLFQSLLNSLSNYRPLCIT